MFKIVNWNLLQGTVWGHIYTNKTKLWKRFVYCHKYGKKDNLHQCDKSSLTASLKMLSSCNQCGGKATFGIKLKTHSIKLYIK